MLLKLSVLSQFPMGEIPTGEQQNYRPAFLQQSSLTSSESEDDDGFLELLDEQDLKVCTKEIRQTLQNQLCLMLIVCQQYVSVVHVRSSRSQCGKSNCKVVGNPRR